MQGERLRCCSRNYKGQDPTGERERAAESNLGEWEARAHMLSSGDLHIVVNGKTSSFIQEGRR